VLGLMARSEARNSAEQQRQRRAGDALVVVVARDEGDFHAFGAKVLGLARYVDAIASSDSASWSLRGRHVPGCTPTHSSESNCLRFALSWHRRLLLGPTASLTTIGDLASTAARTQPATHTHIGRRRDAASPADSTAERHESDRTLLLSLPPEPLRCCKSASRG
jgi:hypothetical protein